MKEEMGLGSGLKENKFDNLPYWASFEYLKGAARLGDSQYKIASNIFTIEKKPSENDYIKIELNLNSSNNKIEKGSVSTDTTNAVEFSLKNKRTNQLF